MDIRVLTKDDIEKTIDLYARCMAESEYFRSRYHLRRANDFDELVALLAMEHGPVLSRTVAYGTSFGAWEADALIGICVLFWYNVIRDHDRSLASALFNIKNGVAGDGGDICRHFAGHRGSLCYNLALCVLPPRRRDKIATRMLDIARIRLHPDWIAAAVHGTDVLPVYRSMPCDEYELKDGRILCMSQC